MFVTLAKSVRLARTHRIAQMKLSTVLVLQGVILDLLTSCKSISPIFRIRKFWGGWGRKKVPGFSPIFTRPFFTRPGRTLDPGFSLFYFRPPFDPLSTPGAQDKELWFIAVIYRASPWRCGIHRGRARAIFFSVREQVFNSSYEPAAQAKQRAGAVGGRK